MDLAEFLLARIAEDEAAVSPFVAIAFPTGQWSEARVLAECEAKRRIIGRFQMFSTMTELPRMEIRHNELLDVLHTLALPYAEHPDYREGWKV
jgi:hypothetical protein